MQRSFFIILLSLFVLFGFGVAGTIWRTSSQSAAQAETLSFVSRFESPAIALPAFGTLESKCDLSIEPKRVGLQIGHWQNRDLPEELAKIRTSDGAVGGGKLEWEAMQPITIEAQRLLEQQGIRVDVLPATVPPDYCAHAFVTIHADSSTDLARRGYKAAGSGFDQTGQAELLAKELDRAFAALQTLPYEPTVTRNMTHYYAFNHRRYEHTVHPKTPAAIMETGFLTNPADQEWLLTQPEQPAQAIATAIVAFLNEAAF